MTDIDPIPAEFGALGEGSAIVPPKPEIEADHSNSFKETLDKKSRTVNEKEKGDEAGKEDQAEHQLRTEAPLIEDWAARQPSNLKTVFDVEKAAYIKKTTSSDAPEKSITTKSSSDSSNADTPHSNLPHSKDSFAESLPDAPIILSQKTEEAGTPTAKTTLPQALSSVPVKEPSPEIKTEVAEKPEITLKTTESSNSQNKGSDSGQPKSQAPLVKNSEKVLSNRAPARKEAFGQVAIPKEFEKQVDLVKQTIAATPLETKTVSTEKPKPFSAAGLSEVKALPKTEQTSGLQPFESKEMPAIQEQSLSVTPIPQETAPLGIEESLELFTAPLFEGPVPIDSRKKEETISPKKTEEMAEGMMRIQAPSESNSLEQEKKDEEDKDEFLKSGNALLENLYPSPQSDIAPLQAEGTPAPAQVISGFDNLHPAILNLFDRLLGIITVIQMQGKTETTFTLNANQSEALKGTEVKITTYDTAPLAYNIELSGPPEAVNLLQKNVTQLQNSFKDPKKGFNFGVNEITVSLQSDKKLETEKNKNS